jgi:hypothetical protein
MVSLPFLKEIAAILLQPGEYNLSETCVVFPNKRARLYLSKFIGELTDAPVWAPAYMSINELMESISGYILADRLTLLFELFSMYNQVTGTPENFDNFYPYADALLADFDEIDKYLANAGDLFSNLAGLKALEGRFSYLSDEQVAAIRRFWNTFDPEIATEGQKTFLSLWEVLPEMYSGLRDRLEKKGLAYEGMAYRSVAESLSANKALPILQGKKYVFIGFNALNTCEERLFRYLKNAGTAEFFWDYDTWYTSNEVHEAGFFMRKNLIDFPPKKEINHNNLVSGEKQIFFLPVPSNTGQAEALPFVFEKLGIKNKQDLEHVALVLADENLLIPALYAIPEMVSDLNITMGYPMAGSAVFNLVDSLYEFGRNRRFVADGTMGYYYKDVMSLLGNPLLKPIYREHLNKIRDMVVKNNLVFLSASEILSGATDDILFHAGAGEGNTCQYLLGVVEHLLRMLSGHETGTRTDPVQLEILFQVYNFLTRLKDILDGYSLEPEQETVFRLIRRMMRTLHIPFSGEPLSGLQLLGILETRTLDFDRVIILSMNESVLPRSNTMPSFIPHNLRVGFGLPVPGHQDSIYAYYFFRLIQRTSQVMLVYDNSTGGLRTGERSRFLHQLFYELPDKVEEISVAYPIALLPVIPISVNKTVEIAAILRRYTGEEARLLSPSAINEFLNCSLRFYFHHIAGLPQPDEIAEDIDARMFGNLLHKSMQLVYEDLGTTLITRERLQEVLNKDETIEDALTKAFHEVLFGNNDGISSRRIEGFNQIVRQVLKSYIRQLVSADMEGGPFTVLGLEQQYSTLIPVSVEGQTIFLKIGGTIDRVDHSEGLLRIIDYKTGSVKRSFSTVESLFDEDVKDRNDAVFQVLTYSMVYHHLHPESTVVPALCFVRGSHSESFSYTIHFAEKKKALDSYNEIEFEFEALLKTKLSGLFDTRESFTQTKNRMICQTCPYAVICRREGNL